MAIGYRGSSGGPVREVTVDSNPLDRVSERDAGATLDVGWRQQQKRRHQRRQRAHAPLKSKGCFTVTVSFWNRACTLNGRE